MKALLVVVGLAVVAALVWWYVKRRPSQQVTPVLQGPQGKSAGASIFDTACQVAAGVASDGAVKGQVSAPACSAVRDLGYTGLKYAKKGTLVAAHASWTGIKTVTTTIGDAATDIAGAPVTAAKSLARAGSSVVSTIGSIF